MPGMGQWWIDVLWYLIRHGIICLGITIFLNGIPSVITVVSDSQDTGYLLPREPKYLLLTPRQVRAGQELSVYVHILKGMTETNIVVQASVSRDDHEVASTEPRHFIRDSDFRPAFVISMQMPDVMRPGNYSIRVEGRTPAPGSSRIFLNESKLAFNPKPVSVFIQVDLPVTNKAGTVNFRVIALKPTLLPVQKVSSIDVYIKNMEGMVMRRWLAVHMFNAVWEGEFVLGDPILPGTWTIEVHGWGHTYTQKFRTERAWTDIVNVNLTAPVYVMENEAFIAGLVTGNHSDHTPTNGNASIEIEIHPPGQTSNFPVIKYTRQYFEGRTDFMVPLEEIRKHSPQLAGTKVVTKATLFDYEYWTSNSATQTTYIYSDDVNLYILGGRSRVFKPEAVFHLYVAVYYRDGTPYSNLYDRSVKVDITETDEAGITTTNNATTVIIPDSGLVHHTYTPSLAVRHFIITVRHGSKRDEVVAYRHYTEGKHFLRVSSRQEIVKLNSYMEFSAWTSMQYKGLIPYVIVAKGNIVTHGAFMFRNVKYSQVSVTVNRHMVPYARIVAYWIKHDEVITDSLNFYVDGLAQSKMEVHVNKGQDFSLNTLEVSAVSTPNAFVAFTAIQWELYSRGGNRDGHANMLFTKYALEQDMISYEMGANLSATFTWLRPNERNETIHRHAPCSAIDANTTFVFAGLDIFTDANVPRIPSVETACNFSLGWLPCNDGVRCYSINDSCNGARFCPDGKDEMGCPDTLPYGRPDAFAEHPRMTAHYDSALWMWKSIWTKPNSRTDLTVNAPVRPGTWVIGAFSIDPVEGLAFTNEPVRVETTRLFYMVMEVPQTTQKGEQIGVRTALFNYWHEPLEVLVTLLGSDQYRYVIVNDYGIVSSYAPRTISGDIQTMVYMPPGDGRNLYFSIVPVTMGKVTVKVKASCVLGSAESTGTVTVSMDGVEVMWHTPYFFYLINTGSVKNPSLNVPTAERFQQPENNYNDYVPGSPEAVVSLVGDVVGPTLDDGWVRTEDVFYAINGGSGETFLFEFAYNLNLLLFLKTTNQLSLDTLHVMLDKLTRALCPISAYMKPDGSFGFRKAAGYGGSVWVTAFGLETLSEGMQSEWEERLYMDREPLNAMARWLVAQQDPHTGAFQETNYIYDIKLQSNLTNDRGVPLNISITAYAAIGLAKSAAKLSGEVQTRAQAAFAHAADYLRQHFNRISDVFELCLVTYALHVTNNPFRDHAFNVMNEKRRSEDYTYWSQDAMPGQDTFIINTIPYLNPKRPPHPGDSRAVQATAYALLVYLQRRMYDQSLPIVRFLQIQRSTDRGFAATQDTLMAIRALREYGEWISDRSMYEVQFQLEATATTGHTDLWEHEIHMKRDNFIRYIQFRTPTPFGSIWSAAYGTGIGLMQLTTKATVEKEFLIVQPELHSFDLYVEYLNYSGYNQSRMDMSVCFRWRLPEVSPRSGSAVLQIELPSGFLALKKMLNVNVKRLRLPASRPRHTKRLVLVYLDYVDLEGDCFRFHTHRVNPIANSSIQHRMRIYDMFNPGYQNTSMYETWTLFHLHVCQVCASFQCPYCPHYNSARPTSAYGIVTSLLLTLVCLTLRFLLDNLP